MTSKNTAVFGIFQNADQADHTVNQLMDAHFRRDDISVLLQMGLLTPETLEAEKAGDSGGK